LGGGARTAAHFFSQPKESNMRELTGHKVNPANDVISVIVTDEPGAGGANHAYECQLPDGTVTAINFQNGPIAEAGVNGLTHEALLAIVIDRMQAFQRGPYSCRENALALAKLEEAQHWLLSRTRERMARNVEGTHKL
jgi:hypothetical protein